MAADRGWYKEDGTEPGEWHWVRIYNDLDEAVVQPLHPGAKEWIVLWNGGEGEVKEYPSADAAKKAADDRAKKAGHEVKSQVLVRALAKFL